MVVKSMFFILSSLSALIIGVVLSTIIRYKGQQSENKHFMVQARGQMMSEYTALNRWEKDQWTSVNNKQQ